MGCKRTIYWRKNIYKYLGILQFIEAKKKELAWYLSFRHLWLKRYEVNLRLIIIFFISATPTSIDYLMNI